MKIIAEEGNQIVLRFDGGEEVIAGLAAFARERGIKAGSLTGLGSSKEIEISWYDLETKEYERKTICENFEIVSLVGNMAFLENAPLIHIHAVFGRSDLSLVGGHVHRLVVSATAEISLRIMPQSEMRRAKDDFTGLNLLQ